MIAENALFTQTFIKPFHSLLHVLKMDEEMNKEISAMFDKLRDRYTQEDKQREAVISETRRIIKMSKEIIYSLHRDDVDSAKGSISAINAAVKRLASELKDSKYYFTGSFKVAVQEYVEALAYYHFVSQRKLLFFDEIKDEYGVSDIDFEHYLLGICDLSGELVRYALKSSIKENYSRVSDIHAFVTVIYEEMSKFDFRNSELRKKSDSIRWDLNKLEEMIFELKVRDKA